MDWRTWTLGLASGFILVAIGKGVDLMLSERKRELESATILGELRAGFSGMAIRMLAVEKRMSDLEARIQREQDRHNALFHHRGN